VIQTNTSVLTTALTPPEYVDTLEALASAWVCQSLSWRLALGSTSIPFNIGAHIRRSFLGALSRGASPQARHNFPCPWVPPCAFDVFGREQLRCPLGQGLPKPYVIAVKLEDGDLILTLRIFGKGNDWSMAAAEAMVLGLQEILPWHFLYPGRKGPPEILGRCVERLNLEPILEGQGVKMEFTSPMVVSMTDLSVDPVRVLIGLMRRVDMISRWNEVGLSPEAARCLAPKMRERVVVVAGGLEVKSYTMPNAKRQKRANRMVLGSLEVKESWRPIWPLLVMGAQCHAGRGAVNGLGGYRLVSV